LDDPRAYPLRTEGGPIMKVRMDEDNNRVRAQGFKLTPSGIQTKKKNDVSKVKSKKVNKSGTSVRRPD
jgi:hypothetical protein